MQTLTTVSPESDLRFALARDIAQGLYSGRADFSVRTPAHRERYTPLLDVVSESIGAPDDPILKPLLKLLAAAMRKSAEPDVLAAAVDAYNAIISAHVESQIEAAVEQDAIADEEAEYFPFARRATA